MGINVKGEVDVLVTRANDALSHLEKLCQEQVDAIVKKMYEAGYAQREHLAALAIDETGRGVYEHKIIKNTFATENVWNSIKDLKTCGIINEDLDGGITDIAEPVGVICGVTPITNPTSTTMFKILIALKARNPIIFAFHPGAQNCSTASAQVLLDAAMEAGAPEGCIQWVEVPSLEATQELMNHEGVSLVLATGGSGMVKSAYSTGKPALGVGSGNVPAYIEKTADLERTIDDIVFSKVFDNGMICAAEQAVIADEEIYEEVIEGLVKRGSYVATPEEVKLLEKVVINEKTGVVDGDIVGKTPKYIANKAGFEVPEGTNIIIAELKGTGKNYPLSREKLSPVLACVKASSIEEAFVYCEEMLAIGGLGHTATIHSSDREVQKAFGLRMKANRLIINAPSAHGAIGDLYNKLTPSLTLGCGTQGKNSTSLNVSTMHLVNIKKLADRR